MTAAPPDLVIFDCDGVLVDSEPAAARELAASLSRHGWPMDFEEAYVLFRGGTIRSIPDMARARGVSLPPDWIDQTYQKIFSALANVPPIPGVTDALDALDRAGKPYCIGSNGPQSKMDVTLGASGLAARFEGRRFSAWEVAAPKPAPDLFLHAAAAMGAAPDRCVVVGDSLNDAKAARAAGMRCLGYASETDPEDLRRSGAEPFRDMTTLPALLGV